MFRLLRLSKRPFIVALALAASSPAGCEAPAPAPLLGLMGTIPLYWGEAAGIEEVLAGMAEPHWARAQLEQHYDLRPLSALAAPELAPLHYLLLAQPRALTPEENVVLDEWVRGGGRLLLFADPLLTGESRFGLGDPRRPQDVILLSPILERWGLELQFLDDQPAGPETREIAGQMVPINLPGRFAPPETPGDCRLAGGGLLAECTIGRGRVAVLADAAMLDLHEPAPEAAGAFSMLLLRAFGSTGENAGAVDGPEPGPAAYYESSVQTARLRDEGKAAVSETPAHDPP